MTARSVLVTGGSRGIGLATAKLLHARGDRVAVLSRKGDAPDGMLGIACDLRDPAQIEAAVADAAEAHGPTEVLVSNAGVAIDRLLLRYVSSVVAATGSAGQVAYATSKAGLVGLARSTARELASRNVTANVVAPGPIATEMTASLPMDRQRSITEAVPLQRFGTVHEVAAVIGFLTSEDAAYVPGAVVPVDGGLGMGH